MTGIVFLATLKKWGAGLALAGAAILALLVRHKGITTGRRKERLRAGKEALEAGERALAEKRASVESALAQEVLTEEAAKAREVIRDQESQQPDASDADGAKSNLDNELRR